MRIRVGSIDNTVIDDIINEVVEQMHCLVDDVIHQHDIYDDEHKEVKKEVLRIISENIEDYYDE